MKTNENWKENLNGSGHVKKSAEEKGEDNFTPSFDYKKVDAMLTGAKSWADIKNVLFNEMAAGAIKRVMNAELTEHLGYAPREAEYRDTDSKNIRNGYTKKTVKLDTGDLPIEVPRDRDGSFEPKLIKKYERVNSELVTKIISMYGKGMTTRDISTHLEEIYGQSVSATLISKVTDSIMESAREWQIRPLDKMYPIVFLDAMHGKVRTEDTTPAKVVLKAAYQVVGVTVEGKTETLGIYLGPDKETSKFWLHVLTDLKNRGVEDILIACIDGLKGFPEAIEAVFPQTEIQSCIIDQIRNSLRFISQKHHKEFMRDLKPVYKAVSLEEAEECLNSLEEKWGKTYPHVIKSWRENWDKLSSYFKYPSEIRRIIYTTNMVEAYHRQLRKVTKNRSIFPHSDAFLKLLYLATKDIETKRGTSARRDWGLILAQLSIHFEGRIQFT